MSTETKNKLVPRLRFPEFKNDGKWEVKRLGEVAEIIKGEQLNRSDLNEESIYPCLNGGVNPSGYTDKFNSEGNTITISEGGNSCGYVNFIRTKFWLGGHCYKLKEKEFIDKMFLFQLLKSVESKLMKLRVGSGLPNIQLRSLKEFELIVSPSLPEQQKIASCLSSIDELIEAESQKLELYQQHKKGLLQNLFPQEGEKVPKLRFPEFQNDGEWEVKKLGEVFKSFSGGTPDTLKKEYYNGKIPFIRSAEIAKLSTELFLTELGLKNSSAKLVSKGDLLIALYGANSGDVAISKIDGAINQAVLCLQSEFSNEFAYHFLFSKKNWIVSKYVQGGQGNLSGEIVKSISIPFPSKVEQQKIAACLSSLDDLINAQRQKIELLKQHKKGLLQNLFPQAISNYELRIKN